MRSQRRHQRIGGGIHRVTCNTQILEQHGGMSTHFSDSNSICLFSSEHSGRKSSSNWRNSFSASFSSSGRTLALKILCFEVFCADRRFPSGVRGPPGPRPDDPFWRFDDFDIFRVSYFDVVRKPACCRRNLRAIEAAKALVKQKRRWPRNIHSGIHRPKLQTANLATIINS